MKDNFLIIPDAYSSHHSGACVARKLEQLLVLAGNRVYIYTDEIQPGDLHKGNRIPRPRFSATSNWLDASERRVFRNVLQEHNIDVVFVLGSLTNKPLSYISEAKALGRAVFVKIFMQDFFCFNFYACTRSGPCFQCLNGSYWNAVRNGCRISKPSDYVRAFNGIATRRLVERILPQADVLFGSSHEQLALYTKFGISAEKCVLTPLYYDRERSNQEQVSRGDYYVCIAQAREEKGHHLIPDLFGVLDEKIKILCAFSNYSEVEKFSKTPGIQELIDSGQLETRHGVTWKTGLQEVLAKSRGVINTSIWPTTTEYALLEALSYRKPVFAFDVGIHKEIIKNGVNGFISPISDMNVMASQISSVEGSKMLYERICLGAFELFEELTDDGRWVRDLTYARELSNTSA